MKTYEEEQTIYKVYFEYVLENTELQLPNNFDERLSLYKQLLEIANIDEAEWLTKRCAI